MGVQAKVGPSAFHVGAANQETQLQTVDQDMTDVQSDHDVADVEWWNTHILTKMRSARNGNTLTRVTSTKMTERFWIQCRSEQESNAKWRSWENSVLVNRATVRRRARCAQHDGVTDGKVTQCEADLWRDSSEKEQIPVYMRVHQDQVRRGFC